VPAGARQCLLFIGRTYLRPVSRTHAPDRDPADRGHRIRLWIEFVVLFFGAVTAYTVADLPGGPIPGLVLAAAAALLYLRRQESFPRGNLWRAGRLRTELAPMLLLCALFAAAAVLMLAVLDPDRLFEFPRQQPGLWVAVVVLYPILSVYPQELVFRAFLLHRYAPLFTSERQAAAAGAVAFGFAHIIFGNALAVALTTAGGWLFARRYQRTGSLFAVAAEHALYGIVIFTVGLGEFFYHGASRGAG
jgi:membrane protease YdiL (CAAX protease family)